jgi:hypothetical protein
MHFVSFRYSKARLSLESFAWLVPDYYITLATRIVSLLLLVVKLILHRCRTLSAVQLLFSCICNVLVNPLVIRNELSVVNDISKWNWTVTFFAL